ncbi:MAG TPA: hypothetical protein VNH83_28255 [Bryobacteraceae bacterium]|nr:hypothetical protein [Bryobacteraceae bacterium]
MSHLDFGFHVDREERNDSYNPQTGGAGWDPTTPAGKKRREEVRQENERNAARHDSSCDQSSGIGYCTCGFAAAREAASK